MKILIAEDEPEIWKPYKIALEARGHTVEISEDGEECLKKYNVELLKQTHLKSNSTSVARASSSISDNEKAAATTVTSSSNHQKSKKEVTKNGSAAWILPTPPFDAVVLDYRMPKKDGLQTAKEILELDPRQRIIFASAYVKETLEASVKELKKVVELMQKPFEADALVDTIEDRESFEALKGLIVSIKKFDLEKPTTDQISSLFEGLRKLQKGRTF